MERKRTPGKEDKRNVRKKVTEIIPWWSKYTLGLEEAAAYGADIVWSNDSVMRGHDGYVQLVVPSSAGKGHDTYDLYYDENGRLTKAYGHSGNAGFEGPKYY